MIQILLNVKMEEKNWECLFLKQTDRKMESANEEIELIRGYSHDKLPLSFDSISKTFHNRNQEWFLSQLVRFLTQPNDSLRRMIKREREKMESFLVDKVSCSIIFVDSNANKEEWKTVEEETKSISDKGIIFISQNLGDKQFMQSLKKDRLYSSADNNQSLSSLLAQIFASTSLCDTSVTSDTPFGKFVQLLIHIRTGRNPSSKNFALPTIEEKPESVLSPLPTKETIKIPPATPSQQTKTKITSGKLAKEDGYAIIFNRTKVATIIEERPQSHLVPLIAHFLQIVPPDWPFVVFHSSRNEEMLKESIVIQREMASGRLTLRLIPENTPLRNGEEVSVFLTKPWFWEQFEADWILFFQTDSMVCSRSSQSLDEWVGYDYVGAPWPWMKHVRGGNGGLSMRGRKAILRAIKEHPRTPGDRPEDVWFAEKLPLVNGNIPDNEVSRKFSVENPYVKGPQRPVGMHRGGVMHPQWTTNEDFAWMEEYCPETKIFHTAPR
eukprot:TRINITY_DN7331_c0_g1_i1.p1 TRINITY_DN7331_c0_g1~~TRINITY_DN7331_c0_g1_i1.p1  ORF type:complete len:495 (+),score=144.33 TRINITY_DN7331_c0_g1_i1:796-2280(+)